MTRTQEAAFYGDQAVVALGMVRLGFSDVWDRQAVQYARMAWHAARAYDPTSEELYRTAAGIGDEAVRWIRHARRYPADEDRAVLLAIEAASLYHLAERTAAEEQCPSCQASGGPHDHHCPSHPDHEPGDGALEAAYARSLPGESR